MLQKAIKTIVILLFEETKKSYISKSATFLHVRLRVRSESNNNKILELKHTIHHKLSSSALGLLLALAKLDRSSAVGGAYGYRSSGVLSSCERAFLTLSAE